MKRIEYLDVAKGFTILTVILGHTLPTGIWKTLIYSFHMPLFFFLSGYFFHPVSFASLIRKKARQLLLPYVITCILLLLFSALLLLLKGRIQDIPANMTNLLFASFYGSGLDIYTPFFLPQIGAIWFLPALFWGTFFLNLLLRLSHPLPALVFLFFAGICTPQFFWLPWSIQPSMAASFYLFIGYQAKQKKTLELFRRHQIFSWLCGILWLFSALFGGEIILAVSEFPCLMLNLISSVSGIFTFLMLSLFLYKRTRILSGYLRWMGRETLLILCVHLLELRLFPWYMLRTFLTEYLYFQGWRIDMTVALGKIIIATAAVAAKHTWKVHVHPIRPAP